jgi:hypothetical protein
LVGSSTLHPIVTESLNRTRSRTRRGEAGEVHRVDQGFLRWRRRCFSCVPLLAGTANYSTLFRMGGQARASRAWMRPKATFSRISAVASENFVRLEAGLRTRSVTGRGFGKSGAGPRSISPLYRASLPTTSLGSSVRARPVATGRPPDRRSFGGRWEFADHPAGSPRAQRSTWLAVARLPGRKAWLRSILT